MDADRSVKDLYESFPYPPADDDLAPFIERKKMPAFNPRDSFSLFFPNRAPREDLQILVAGCGTNAAQQHAAYLPNAHVVGIDISEASLAQAKKVVDRFGLRNVELVRLPLEEVASLGRTFDFIHCQGVLHHLASPVAGLSALSKVLRDDGAMSLMVYAKYGRAGVYMLQELFRDRLALGRNARDLAKVQQATQRLPDGHPFKIIHPKSSEKICFEELADLLLHPRDIAYAVSDVRALVEQAGMQFQRWMMQAPYRPEVSPLAGTPLDEDFAALDDWARAAAMELFYGRITMHLFVASHPGRPSPEKLFTPATVGDAVPKLSPHVRVAKVDGGLMLHHTQHQFPFEVTLPDAELALLKHIDDQATVAEIAARASAVAKHSNAQKRETAEHARGLFYELHLADMVDLRMRA